MIEVRNLHYTYEDGIRALRGVSLAISDGEFVAIMGENGSGKTTLIKHFNGLLKPTKGKVFIDGIDTRKSSVAELSRKVGIAFQNPNHAFFAESVEEEIRFALKNFGFAEEQIEERIQEVLDLFGLGKFRERSPFTLSEGQKKLLTIAIVYAWDPKILIFDEPTLGQDYRCKEKLRTLFSDLVKAGKSVIIATHDIEFVAECNPRVILLSNGKIVADGPAKQVLTGPKLVGKASLVLPQIAQLFLELADLNLPTDVLSVGEAVELLLERRGLT